ncbi:MAG: hypothetical protein CM1200mP40_33260 [Gammaproteobacteria bacterium]|nr:MAG: hypothetical protein CM1200mP40_33260 [Gammaproteobacteria bacterium]
MSELKNFLLITFVVFLPAQFVLGEVSLVNTDAGTYRGHSSQHADRVTVFQGIAFAAPPVRDLRWKPPAPVIPFAVFAKLIE